MYLIDYTKLEAGDVILTGSKSFIGAVVKVFTFSRFSHAMIWVDSTLIHSDGGGVYSKNPQRILFQKRSQVKVLRSRRRLSPLQKMMINNYARSQVCTVYSTIEAALVTVPLKRPLSERQFCSRFVAQCYTKAGMNIVKNTYYCSPGELDNPDIFDEISDAVVLATPGDISFCKRRDVNAETQNDTINMLKEIRKKYGENIQTISHVVDFILKNPGADAVITDIALKSGYFDHAEVDIEVNSWRYNESEFLECAKAHNIPISILAKETHDVGTSTLNIYKKELKTNTNLWNESRALFFYHQALLYKRLVNMDYIRKDLSNNVVRNVQGISPSGGL